MTTKSARTGFKDVKNYVKFSNRLIKDGYLDQYLRDCQIAFMMGFHKRLGKDTLIRRFMSRDIGRWFCQRYITNANNGMKQVISFTHPEKYLSIMKSFVSINAYDNTRKRLLLETPKLELYIGITIMNQDSDAIRYSFMAGLDMDNRKHVILFNNVRYLEQLLTRHIFDNRNVYVIGRRQNDIMELKSIIKDNRETENLQSSKVYISMSLSSELMQKTTVYYKKQQYTFKQAFENGYFKRNCYARFIFHVSYIYTMNNIGNYHGYRYIPVQIEVFPSKDLDEYAFSDSE